MVRLSSQPVSLIDLDGLEAMYINMQGSVKGKTSSPLLQNGLLYIRYESVLDPV